VRARLVAVLGSVITAGALWAAYRKLRRSDPEWHLSEANCRKAFDFLRSLAAPRVRRPEPVWPQACQVCGSRDIASQPFSGGVEYYCAACEEVYSCPLANPERRRRP
jgi:hypothetical protein